MMKKKGLSTQCPTCGKLVTYQPKPGERSRADFLHDCRRPSEQLLPDRVADPARAETQRHYDDQIRQWGDTTHARLVVAQPLLQVADGPCVRPGPAVNLVLPAGQVQQESVTVSQEPQPQVSQEDKQQEAAE